jgi:hypothetical protein
MTSLLLTLATPLFADDVTGTQSCWRARYKIFGQTMIGLQPGGALPLTTPKPYPTRAPISLPDILFNLFISIISNNDNGGGEI